MIDHRTVGGEIGSLLNSKQKAYGNAFGQSGKIMRLLYPKGISPEAMEDSLTLVRIIDKMFRIANNKNAYGENPFMDIAGYAILAVAKEKSSGLKAKRKV